MPLTENQIEKLNKYLEPLIFFNESSKKSLKSMIALLNQTLKREPQQIAPPPQFVMLQKQLFEQPHLLIEKSTDTQTVTLGDVKHGVVDVIDKKVKQIANKHKISDESLTKIWRPEEVKAMLTAPYDSSLVFSPPLFNSQTPIVSRKLNTTEYSCYKAQLILKNNQLILSLKINVVPWIEQTEYSLRAVDATLLSNEVAANRYLDAVESEAIILARQQVFYLIYQKVTNRALEVEQPNWRTTLTPHQICLTQAFHLQLLLNNYALLAFYLGLTPELATKFARPVIINLLQNQQLSFETAAQLTAADERVLDDPDFSKLIQSFPLWLIELTGLTDLQAQLLLAHPVKTLIKDGKLPIEFVKAFSPDFAKLMWHPFYFERFSKDSINWEKTPSFTADEVSFLLHAEIVQFFKHQKIELDDIFNFLPYLYLAATHPDQLPFVKIKKCLALYYELSVIKYAVRGGVISIDEYFKSTLEQTAELLFSRRLIALFEKKPFQLPSYDDSVSSVISDIKTFVDKTELTIQLAQLNENCLRLLLMKVSTHLQEVTLTHFVAKNVMKELQAILTPPTSSEQRSGFYTNIFTQLVNKAKTINKKIPAKDAIIKDKYPRQFNGSPPDIEKLRELCSNLDSFNALIPNERPNNYYGNYN